jgi:hypothetical protein
VVYEDENEQRKQKWLPSFEDYVFNVENDEARSARAARQATCQDYVFAQDSPDLPVVSNGSLAAGTDRLALKAREIWFQRFREVLEPALPRARRGTLFLLDRSRPISPYRTFIVKLSRELSGSTLPRPTCPECGRLCDVAVNLNFTHHDLDFPLPGSGLLMHVCSEDNIAAAWWHHRWIDRAARPELEAVLHHAERCLAGPAVRVVEYDAEAVDYEVTARPGPHSEAFNDRWENSDSMFASTSTKVGGGVFWIQSNPRLADTSGNPMRYIGQVSCNDFLEIGDSGVAYLLYSPATGETKIDTQCY